MKLKYMLIIGALILGFSACKDDDGGNDSDPDPMEKTGTLRLMIDQKAMGLDGNMADAVRDTFAYKNAAGDTFAIDHLKYYISNFTLASQNGQTYYIPDSYYLIRLDHTHPSPQTVIDIPDIPVADYQSISFIIGVDSVCNLVTPCQVGDLDPLDTSPQKMIWDWNLPNGYKFMRFEGQYKDAGANNDFVFHVGNNSSARNCSFTDDLIIKENETTMAHFHSRVHQIFSNPETISLKVINAGNATKIANNYGNGFLVLHHIQ